MSNNMQTLIATAAELRSGGHPWEYVADQVHRSPRTVRQWPIRYADAWKILYREAEKKRYVEASAEALGCLRTLLAEGDDRVRIKAADVLLKFRPEEVAPTQQALEEAYQYVEQMKAFEERQKRSRVELIEKLRKNQGLEPLSEKEMEKASYALHVGDLWKFVCDTPEYNRFREYGNQGLRGLYDAVWGNNTVAVVGLLLAIALGFFLGHRDWQRESVNPNIEMVSNQRETKDPPTTRICTDPKKCNESPRHQEEQKRLADKDYFKYVEDLENDRFTLYPDFGVVGIWAVHSFSDLSSDPWKSASYRNLMGSAFICGPLSFELLNGWVSNRDSPGEIDFG